MRNTNESWNNLMGFFRELDNHTQLIRWIDFLDILFGGEYFPEPRWNTSKKTRFTKIVKQLPRITKENWIVKPQKEINWELIDRSDIHIVMIKGDAEGKSLLRHIRNSIAHGNCKIRRLYNEDMLEMMDYRDDGHTIQTADILIPLEMIHILHQKYNECRRLPNKPPKRSKKHVA